MTRARKRDEPEFRPFSDDTAVVTLGTLSVENGTRAVAIHGALELPRDRAGLKRARKLKAWVDAIVATLEDLDLPKTVAEADQPASTVKNPFA